MEKNKEIKNRPVFIIGAPRSGSTLLYQMITDYFDVGYLSNLHCLLYPYADKIQSFIDIRRWKKKSNYNSRLGRTYGIFTPCECGRYWYQFFRREPNWVELKDTNKHFLDRMRKSVIKLVKSYNKPVIFKNLYNTVRLEPIMKALPEAKFIVIKRDIQKNISSIIRVRKNNNCWLSYKTKNFSELEKLPLKKCLMQYCHTIYDEIDKYKNNESFIEISYEILCKEPIKVLNKIQKKLNLNKDERFAKDFVFIKKYKLKGRGFNKNENIN